MDAAVAELDCIFAIKAQQMALKTFSWWKICFWFIPNWFWHVVTYQQVVAHTHTSLAPSYQSEASDCYRLAKQEAKNLIGPL